jgi:hypothetical protein
MLLSLFVSLVAASEIGGKTMFPSMNTEESNLHNQQLITRFQQEIGIDAFRQAEHTIPVDKGIVMDEWPNMLQFFPSTDTGWILEDESVYLDTSGIMERDITYDKGEVSRVAIWIFVSSGHSPKVLLSRLAQFGIMTSMLNAYKLGPNDLGNISVITNAESAYIDEVFWVNHNILIKISRRESNIDILGIAYSLNEFLNKHIKTDIPNFTPSIDHIEISPSHVAVSEPVWIKLHPATDSDIPHLIGPELEDTKDGTLDVQAQDTLAIQLKIDTPGRFEIPMWVGDKRTLLSSRIIAHIEVLSHKQ